MNIHEPRPRAAAIYVDFNQDFMHSGTWSIGMAVLVPCRFQSRFLARKNQSGFLATERAVFVPLQDFRINLDFNQDFMTQWNRVHRNSRASSFVDFNLDLNLDFNQENRHNGTVPLAYC
jgi:hypothetical protein